MINYWADYRYESTKDYEVLGMDYKGDFTMFIVLPKERFGLTQVLKKLTGSALIKHAKNHRTKSCRVSPKEIL